MATRGTRMHAGGRKKGKDGAWGRAGHRPKKHREAALPGMEDHAILWLDQLSQQYADLRDRRIELNKEESELKTSLLKLMKGHNKTLYRHGGVTIRVIAGEEDVKVKVAPLEAPDELGAEPLDIQVVDPAPAPA